MFIFSNVYTFTQNHTHSFIHSFIYSLTSSFIYSFTHSFIYSLIYFFICSSLAHSFTLSFILSFMHSLPFPCSHSLRPSLTTYTYSSLFPSTASFQEAEPPSRLGPSVPTPRTFSSLLTSSLLNCAGMCPGVQRISFPLRNRCSCNYRFVFHPLMPENSTSSSSMQEAIHSAWAGPAAPGGSDSRTQEMPAVRDAGKWESLPTPGVCNLGSRDELERRAGPESSRLCEPGEGVWEGMWKGVDCLRIMESWSVCAWVTVMTGWHGPWKMQRFISAGPVRRSYQQCHGRRSKS